MKLTTALGIAAVLAGSSAIAQTSATSTERVKPVATSQQTADEAARKAAADGNTASFVRTGPSAGDHVGDTAHKAKTKATRAKDKAVDKTTDKSTTTNQ